MTHLYLVRHAEADCNVRDVMGGPRGDRGLTELGVRQAERLRDRLASGEIQADVLLTSSLRRARETAEIVAPALGLAPVVDDALQEQNPGEADGLTLAEIRRRWGLPDFREQPFTPLAPGAETWGQFMLRVATALERIARERQDRTTLLICHGGVIDGSFVHFFRLPSQVAPPVAFFTHNTALTHWLLHRGPGGAARWRLERYNDVTHLRDLGAARAIPWEDLARQAVLGEETPAGPLLSEPREPRDRNGRPG